MVEITDVRVGGYVGFNEKRRFPLEGYPKSEPVFLTVDSYGLYPVVAVDPDSETIQIGRDTGERSMTEPFSIGLIARYTTENPQRKHSA
ncbi:MAG: hypothetical protein ISS48_01680 [Candidatus Aenigmarchaeota archaeon]|nr:hypothetical protein [Candidatus Aenigmarchaeota archaeon]